MQCFPLVSRLVGHTCTGVDGGREQWKICYLFFIACPCVELSSQAKLPIASSPLPPGSGWVAAGWMMADGSVWKMLILYILAWFSLWGWHSFIFSFGASLYCTERTDFILNSGYSQSTCLHFFALCFCVWMNKPRPQQEHESRAESLLRTAKRCWNKISAHINFVNSINILCPSFCGAGGRTGGAGRRSKRTVGRHCCDMMRWDSDEGNSKTLCVCVINVLRVMGMGESDGCEGWRDEWEETDAFLCIISAPPLYRIWNLEQRQINPANLKKKERQFSRKKRAEPKKEQQRCVRYSGNEPWHSFSLVLTHLN